MNLKKDYVKKKVSGTTLLTIPILLFFCFIFLLTVGVFLMNIMKSFVWYEKLNHISNEYIFLIEKFGYLTVSEKEKLEEDLRKSGFEIEKIKIEYPDKKVPYGTLIQFCIQYELDIPMLNFINKLDKRKNQNIIIEVNKYSFSKGG